MSGPAHNNELVTVCAACLTASCWHGEFYCDKYKSANITKRTRAELDAMGLEHPDNYSRRKIAQVNGGNHE